MVQDFRRITLSRAETIHAIDSYRRTSPEFLPGGEITSMEPRNKDEIIIHIKMVYGKNVNDCSFEFMSLDFMPVIAKFCSENNILLPEHDKHCIIFEDNKISLITTSES